MEKKKNILVIDDVPTNIKLISAHLKNSEIFTVTAKGNGREGLSYLLEHYKDVDLVFLDISMPEVTGIEVCQKFREKVAGEENKLPIIAYTAHAMPDEKELFLSRGFDDLLIKPVTRDTIFSALKKWLPDINF